MAKLVGKGFLEGGLKLRAAIGQGLYEFAQEIMDESQQIVPVDTGTLHDSAVIEEPVFNTQTISLTFGYAIGDHLYDENPKTLRPAGSYAVDVHEITSVFHEPPTQAKFLEQPLLEGEEHLVAYIQKAVIERIG